MQIFYTPNIAQCHELTEEESLHCVKVLRMTEGEEIRLTDGKGNFYRATIALAHHKRCAVEIVEIIPTPNPWNNRIEIAIAPTKNMDRIEWFVEKAVEIGVDAITLLKCRYSERKEVKMARIEKIAISAMKQSLKSTLPTLREMQDISSYIKECHSGQKFMAHCYEGSEKLSLKSCYNIGSDAVVMIGPEGDFSEQEVSLALGAGFAPITLGDSRLRTETAGVVACHTLQLLNM